MNKSILLVSMLGMSLTSTVFAANHTVSDKAVVAIQQLAAKPKLVEAVAKINAQRQTDGRQTLNHNKKQWRQEYPQKKGELISKVTQSPLAKWLNTQVKNSHGQYLGALVLDKQGNNIAQTYLTKNYSQSSRVIWHKVKQNVSAVYMSRARTDKQFGQRLRTVSVPVVSADKHIIGALVMKVAAST